MPIKLKIRRTCKIVKITDKFCRSPKIALSMLFHLNLAQRCRNSLNYASYQRQKWWNLRKHKDSTIIKTTATSKGKAIVDTYLKNWFINQRTQVRNWVLQEEVGRIRN